MNWEDQKNGACYSGQYEWTDKLKEYKDAILGGNDIIRLIGLSGHGKTRLVAESYRENDSREKYLYGDMQLLDEKERRIQTPEFRIIGNTDTFYPFVAMHLPTERTLYFDDAVVEMVKNRTNF